MKKAFTLLEMMVVLAIIAVISAIAIPNLMRISVQKNSSKAKAELRALQVAVENYYLYHSSVYPAALSDLVTAVPSVVKAIGTDPFSKTQSVYKYNVSPNKKYYVIYSIGPSANGSAVVTDDGVLTETNGASCIYVSDIQEDSTP